MTWFTKWAFKNKASVILMVVLVLGAGVMGYLRLPLEYMPEGDMPQVSVTTVGQGYDATSMAASVTNPVERAVSSVKNKTNVLSTTGDGYSQVNIGFKSGIDMKAAKAEVAEAISGLSFPDGIVKPNVMQLDTSMIPIAEVTIGFKDGMTNANMELLETKIKPKLQDVDGVSNVGLFGKAETHVSVKVDNEKLTQMNIPFQVVLGTLQGQNLSVAVADRTIDNKSSNLKVTSNLNSLDALKNLAVVPGVKLGDIATVDQKIASESVTRVNGQEALYLIVQKEGGANTVEVGNSLEKQIEELNTQYPNIEAGVFWSSADMVKSSADSMMAEVGMGALFATIVILLFLRSIRTTLITIVSIPLSLGLTLFLLYQFGFTLNIMTLGGVAVAVGRLVDDSIVVIENIFRRTQQGNALTRETIVDSVKEVAGAITSSTLTTVAVFLPMGLVEGQLHDFLLPFAATVTFSLLSSLLVALTVVPLMSKSLLKASSMPQHKEPKRYVRLLGWSLNHKIVTVLIAIVLFGGSIGLYISLPQGVINASDSSMVNVSMAYPSDTTSGTVLEKAKQMESFLREQPEVKSVVLMSGTNSEALKYGNGGSAAKADFAILMKKDVDAEPFIDRVKTEKAKYEGADVEVSASSMMSSTTSVVTLDLVGTNVDELVKTSETIMPKIKAIDGVDKITSNQQETKPVYAIEVNTAEANAQEIASGLHPLLNETPIGTVKLDGKDTTVMLQPLAAPATLDQLNKVPVSTQAGIVSLSQVAKITKSNQASTIYQKDGSQYLRLTIQSSPEKVKEVSSKIAAMEKDFNLPAGVKLQQGGSSEDASKDMMQLGLTAVASIGIVYLIMVMTFKTLRAPFAILFSLPLAAVGAVLGLLIARVTVDPTVMIGALMLIGIVVTNAIVLLERVKHNEETMTIREALLEAGSVRLRPIIMTAVATVCAMLPLLFKGGESASIVSKSLAVVVIGGLSVSTLLTLIFVPVVYEMLHFRKAKKQRMAQKTSAKELAA